MLPKFSPVCSMREGDHWKATQIGVYLACKGIALQYCCVASIGIRGARYFAGANTKMADV